MTEVKELFDLTGKVALVTGGSRGLGLGGSMDNVIVTPHIASHTLDGVRAMGVGVAEEVCAVLNGARPRWLANPEVWDSRRIAVDS